MIDPEKVIEELEPCLTASCRGKSGYCPIPDKIWDNLFEVLELLKSDSIGDIKSWIVEIALNTNDEPIPPSEIIRRIDEGGLKRFIADKEC